MENPAAVYAKNMSIGGPIIDFNGGLKNVNEECMYYVACDSSKSLVCVQFWLICRKCSELELPLQ